MYLLLFLFIILWIVFMVLFLTTKKCDQKENITSLDDIGSKVNQLIPDPQSQRGGSGDKGSHHHDYLDYYELLLSRFHAPFSLLEIGIAKGYSLVTWLKKYSQISVTGMDVDLTFWNINEPKFHLHPDEKARLRILQANATLPCILDTLTTSFNVILDDGSHITNDMIASFEILFPHRLAKGGIYIVEDVHCDQGMVSFLQYAQSLIPYAYKSSTMDQCQMLSGRENMIKASQSDWRFSIKEIIFHRDIVVFTKESW